MTISVSVQYHGGSLPDITALTITITIIFLFCTTIDSDSPILEPDYEPNITHTQRERSELCICFGVPAWRLI